MKLTLITSFLLGCLFFSPSAFSQEKANKTMMKETQNKSVEKKKKRRRKKVLMCQDCGKPETECDCEGHGDHKEHSDHDEHKKHKKEKKN